ncbi:MAG: YopX family protein [Peptostreptococcaceae bacterium]
MREIKFRAYDKVNDNMVYSNDIDCSHGYWFNIGHVGAICMIEHNYCDKFGEEHTSYEDIDNIMQYTELRDINRKEIFEGDIVQCNGNKEDLHEVKYGEFEVYNYDSDGAIDTVFGWHFKILENDKFSKVVPFCYPTPLNNYWIKKADIKVIGNIYENRELLEIE